MKNLLKLIIIAIIILPSSILANMNTYNYYYIDIYFENNQIFLDKNSVDPVQVSNDSIKSNYEFYLGEDNNSINRDDYIELRFEGFNPEYKWTVYLKDDLVQGNNKIQVPYYPHAKTVEIIFQNKRPLEVNLSSIATCNQNNVCEYEQGETELGCIMDCYYDENTKKPIVYSTKTEQTLQANNGILRNEEGTVLLRSNLLQSNQPDNNISEEEDKAPIWPLILGIILLIVGLGVFIYFRIKRKNQ